MHGWRSAGRAALVFGGTLAVAACTSKEARSRDSAAGLIPGTVAGRSSRLPSNPASPPATGKLAPSMPMRGMSAANCSAMMDSLRLYARALRNATGTQIAALLSTHRAAVTSMIVHMQSMNVSASPAWTATADSVRADLDRFNRMSPAELEQAMPSHQARVWRLMRMHMSEGCGARHASPGGLPPGPRP